MEVTITELGLLLPVCPLENSIEIQTPYLHFRTMSYITHVQLKSKLLYRPMDEKWSLLYKITFCI